MNRKTTWLWGSAFALLMILPQWLQASGGISISTMTPSKIFTPNGDGCNDIIVVHFNNPTGTTSISGKIFDIHGAFIDHMEHATYFSSLAFHPACPAPTLTYEALAWDGRDSDGGEAPKGIYIYQIEADGERLNGTVVVAR